jgi:hypothetical protein
MTASPWSKALERMTNDSAVHLALVCADHAAAARVAAYIKSLRGELMGLASEVGAIALNLGGVLLSCIETWKRFWGYDALGVIGINFIELGCKTSVNSERAVPIISNTGTFL